MTSQIVWNPDVQHTHVVWKFEAISAQILRMDCRVKQRHFFYLPFNTCMVRMLKYYPKTTFCTFRRAAPIQVCTIRSDTKYVLTSNTDIGITPILIRCDS